MFVTMFYLIIEKDKNSILFGSAGHNEQLLFKKDTKSFEYLKVKGIPLGISPESTYIEGETKYAKDDILILYTDGVTEAINKAGNEFEMERFKDVIIQNQELSAKKLGEKILESVDAFSQGMPQFDDITLMIIKFT